MPLFIPIIATVILLSAAGVALNWDRIVIWWKGKKIAVLGARGVGKTTLIRFLTTGSIPENYKQTISPEKVKGCRRQLKDLVSIIKDTLDPPPGSDAYPVWKELFDEADVVFYLLRIDKLMKHDAETENRVRRDMRQIGRWLKERRQPQLPLPPPRFFIIGTHGDLAKPNLTTIPENKRGDEEDRIRALPIIKECVQQAGGGHKARVVLGSLKPKEETEALAYSIFSQVEN